MENVLLSEVRPVILSWAAVAVVVLLMAVIFLTLARRKSDIKNKSTGRELKIFYSVIAFIFFWIALLPFFIAGACKQIPNLSEWSHAIVVTLYAVFALLLLRDVSKK